MSIQRLMTTASFIVCAVLVSACAGAPQSSGISVQAGGSSGSGADSGGSTDEDKSSENSADAGTKDTEGTEDTNNNEDAGNPGGSEDKPSEAELKKSAFYVGNCVTFDVSDGKIANSTIVDCSREHRSEVYFVGYLDAGAYPGDEAIDKEVEATCRREFKGYVGVASDQSEFQFSYLTPNRETWGPKAGDRIYNCMLEKEENNLWTGSAKGSKK
ncbi:MAG: septum formation family protein [Actinomycetaceae bacterium]|nr:septum formation family protein [Actinomycetaceae bacterium]